MGFKLGIIGLPNVGKSTLFNALTYSNKAEAANYPFATIKPNIGRVIVPDYRLIELSKISSSKKTIPAFIDFVDIAGLVKGASKGEGLGNKFLSYIREVDAIAHVVRCYKNENIAHISSHINPIQDIEIISTELKLADIQILEKKLNNLKKKIKISDKKIDCQLDLVSSLLNKLNKNEIINLSEWSNEQKKLIKNFNLISFKPMFYICNVDENSIAKGNNFTKLIKEKAIKENCQYVILSAKIESQITEFKSEKERVELLNDLGLNETALKKVISVGYKILDLITYFTSGPKETRAWTIINNTNASDAAGKIHSDFKNGFIRAETITYKDFISYKGEGSCREAGKLRQEGKNYSVKDGDVLHFLYNI